MKPTWQGTLYFDISDLLEYARVNTTLSGIQRVSMLTISKILATYETPCLRLIAYHPVTRKIECYEPDRFFDGTFDQPDFVRCFELDSLELAGKRQLTLRAYIKRKYRTFYKKYYHKARIFLSNKLNQGRSYKKRGILLYEQHELKSQETARRAPMPNSGDTIFVPGAVWNYDELVKFLEECSQRNVVVIQFVHDLIPIILPEHVINDVPEQFSDWLNSMARIASSFIVNSQSTGQDLKKFLAEVGLSEKKVKVVPLAHEFNVATNVNEHYKPPISFADNYGVVGKIHTRVRNAARLPFVLCVGTIETRKNVWNLARAWISLYSELKYDMPRLIFAGNLGWFKEDFDDLMRASGDCDGLIRIVIRPNDNELEFLYRKCLFSVFLSYYEGWGLPVGEALWCGRPVLASCTSSIPEVGGTYADYVDPNSMSDIISGLRKMITDRDYLEERALNIKSMKKRSWADVAQDLVVALDDENALRQEALAD